MLPDMSDIKFVSETEHRMMTVFHFLLKELQSTLRDLKMEECQKQSKLPSQEKTIQTPLTRGNSKFRFLGYYQTE